MKAEVRLSDGAPDTCIIRDTLGIRRCVVQHVTPQTAVWSFIISPLVKMKTIPKPSHSWTAPAERTSSIGTLPPNITLGSVTQQTCAVARYDADDKLFLTHTCVVTALSLLEQYIASPGVSTSPICEVILCRWRHNPSPYVCATSFPNQVDLKYPPVLADWDDRLQLRSTTAKKNSSGAYVSFGKLFSLSHGKGGEAVQ